MSIIDLNCDNYKFNQLPDSTPSGIYSIILKNSNAIINNNLLGQTRIFCTSKSCYIR